MAAAIAIVVSTGVHPCYEMCAAAGQIVACSRPVLCFWQESEGSLASMRHLVACIRPFAAS